MRTNSPPLAQPELDVQSQPSTENREADVKLTITVTVRPEIELPNYEGLEVEVDEVESPLRTRFRHWTLCVSASAP